MPLGALSPEEPRELTLGQHHGLEELALVESHGPDDLDLRLTVAPRDELPPLFTRGTPHLNGRRNLHVGALATPSGTHVLRRAAYPISAGGTAELDLGERLSARVRKSRTQPLLVGALPRNIGGEGEDDRIENCRLASPGRPLNNEKATATEHVEIDEMLAGVRTQRSESQPFEAHQRHSS